MKKLSRLLLLFSITFALVFVLASAFGVLHTWGDAMRTVPAKSYIGMRDLVPSAEWALPFTLYVTILTSMSYAARKKVNTLAACVTLFVFAFGFTYATSMGINNVKHMDAPTIALTQGTPGKSGLILSGYGADFILLDDPSVSAGERVAALDNSPLLYQENPVDAEGRPIPLPPVPFNIKNAEVFDSLLVDFSLSAKELSGRFAKDFLPYAAYSGVVIFLLLSVAAVLEIGAWPLANVFIGAALFRLILSLEVFITNPDAAHFLDELLGRWIAADYVMPFVLGAAGILLALYSLLVKAANLGRVGKGK